MKNKPISIREGTIHKGGVNPPLETTDRPEPPTGSDPHATIAQKSRELKQTILEVQRKADARIKNLEKKLTQLQNTCSHSKTTFHSDPSGNNDSFLECEICGKTAKRL